jgi:hypothetical protein
MRRDSRRVKRDRNPTEIQPANMSDLGKKLFELSEKAAASGVTPLKQKQISRRLSLARGGV